MNNYFNSYCTSCGSKSVENDKFCRHCGTSLKRASTQAAGVPFAAVQAQPGQAASLKMARLISYPISRIAFAAALFFGVLATVGKKYDLPRGVFAGFGIVFLLIAVISHVVFLNEKNNLNGTGKVFYYSCIYTRICIIAAAAALMIVAGLDLAKAVSTYHHLERSFSKEMDIPMDMTYTEFVRTLDKNGEKYEVEKNNTIWHNNHGFQFSKNGDFEQMWTYTDRSGYDKAKDAIIDLYGEYDGENDEMTQWYGQYEGTPCEINLSVSRGTNDTKHCFLYIIPLSENRVKELRINVYSNFVVLAVMTAIMALAVVSLIRTLKKERKFIIEFDQRNNVHPINRVNYSGI